MGPSALRRGLLFAAAGLVAGGAIARGLPGIGWIAGAVLALAVVAFLLRERGMSPRDASSDDQNEVARALPLVAREVFENLPDPLLLVELSGRIAFANRAMRPESSTSNSGSGKFSN